MISRCEKRVLRSLGMSAVLLYFSDLHFSPCILTEKILQPHPFFRETEKYPIPEHLLRGHLGKLPHIISRKQRKAPSHSLVFKFPAHPGNRRVFLSWRQPGGTGAAFSTVFSRGTIKYSTAPPFFYILIMGEKVLVLCEK